MHMPSCNQSHADVYVHFAPHFQLRRCPIFRFASQVPDFQICFSGTPFSDLLLRFASQVPQFQICFPGTPVSDLLLRCPYLLLRLTHGSPLPGHPLHCQVLPCLAHQATPERIHVRPLHLAVAFLACCIGELGTIHITAPAPLTIVSHFCRVVVVLITPVPKYPGLPHITGGSSLSQMTGSSAASLTWHCTC